MPNPVPVQKPIFSEKDFKNKCDYFNQWIIQVVNTLNTAIGANGTTVLPNGINVAGSTVTGLSAPKNPTDAISAGHADAQYNAKTMSKALDIGGTNTLNGLSNLYLLMQNAASGTVPLAKLTSGGTDGSLTIKGGLVTKIVQPT